MISDCLAPPLLEEEEEEVEEKKGEKEEEEVSCQMGDIGLLGAPLFQPPTPVQKGSCR